jgi:hypothetical protein
MLEAGYVAMPKMWKSISRNSSISKEMSQLRASTLVGRTSD